MRLYKTRGADERSLICRDYNIGVGISLGNKWYSRAHIIEQVRWAAHHSKDYVIIYVADSIHAINLIGRNGMRPDKAIEKAEREGEVLLREIKLSVEGLSLTKSVGYIFARWADIATPEYARTVGTLYQHFRTNINFRNHIKSLVLEFTSHEKRSFSDEAIETLATYLLEELPELASCVPISGIVCDAYVYPFDNKVTQFVEEFQSGRLFPEISREIMIYKPKVFLEVR